MKRLFFVGLSVLLLAAAFVPAANAGNAGTETCPSTLSPGQHCVGSGH